MSRKIKHVWKCAIVAVLAGLVSVPSMASAASVDEVVDKYIEATGGREAQEAVTTMIRKGQLNIVSFGMEAALVAHHKNGNFHQAMEIPGMGEIVQGVSGDVVWQTHPMEGDSILEGEPAQSIRDQAALNQLLNWQERFASAEVVGEEDGTTKVVFKSAGGDEITSYFDHATGLLSKQEASSDEGSVTLTPSDYKQVGDITMAHSLLIETPEVTMEITYASVELNPEIDDSTFDLPEVIQAMLPQSR